MLKLFFTDYCEDKVLAAENARVATKEDILHSMDCVLHMPQNFLGVIDEAGRALQFMVNDDKTIHVDVPSPAERGSYVKVTDLAECLNIIQGIGDVINVAEMRGLAFERW
jgi:hypothetical protein